MVCRSKCETPGMHSSYGECMRQAMISIGVIDNSRQKAWDVELEEYRAARRQNVQPPTTRLADIRMAMEISDQTGRPYGAEGI